MSLEAANLCRRLLSRPNGKRRSTSPRGGASGAAPSLTPTEPTAFLQSVPYVAEEADRADVNRLAAARHASSTRHQVPTDRLLLGEFASGSGDYAIAVGAQGAYIPCGTRFAGD